VTSTSQQEILDAIDKDNFPDFEDCLQDKCAKEIGADYIITINVKDYAESEIPAINPKDFLTMVRHR
jgi:predicted nucleic acid-binding protein